VMAVKAFGTLGMLGAWTEGGFTQVIPCRSQHTSWSPSGRRGGGGGLTRAGYLTGQDPAQVMGGKLARGLMGVVFQALEAISNDVLEVGNLHLHGVDLS
jgi:hypothetical protein